MVNARLNAPTLLVSSLVASLVAISACGGGAKMQTQLGTAGANGGGSAGTNPGSAGTTPGSAGAGGGMTGSTAGAGTGTAGATATADLCMSYCTAIMGNCTGANAQYKDMGDCMTACSFLPAGSPGDQTINTINCRIPVAKAAAADTGTGKTGACFQAGPLSYGTCGQECDAFCAIQAGYCSAAKGYTGAQVYPPSPSDSDCTTICSQFSRPDNIDYTSAGNFNTTGVTGDTLECRAYHLIELGLDSMSAQATECPNAANVSTACGMGVMVLTPTDGGASGDAMGMTYTGTNPINPSNWDETKYPFATRRMILRDEGNPHLHLVDLGHPTDATKNWTQATDGAWARAAQLIGNNQIIGGRNDGYEIYDLTDGHIVHQVKTFPNSMSVYRTANGETMLTQSGTKLTFLDATDKVTHSISYPGYGYVRLARPTRNGTYLVPSDSHLFEGDATGKVLWSVTGSGWSHIWEPLLLGPPVGGGKWNEGDTLLCNAFGSSCDVVDKTTHKITFSFGGKNMTNAAMIKPNFFSEYEILPNGNIIVSNWQGHGPSNGNSGIQVLEFDPTGKVIWSYHQMPTPAFPPADFSSIQGVMVLDGKDPMKLHVQETSTDSTWQPVTPTP
jgi:hypothetical protein